MPETKLALQNELMAALLWQEKRTSKFY